MSLRQPIAQYILRYYINIAVKVIYYTINIIYIYDLCSTLN